MTEQQRLLGGEQWCKQSILLPHDLVESLYRFPSIFFPIFTGEPGATERYWSCNLDLFDTLDMPNLEPWQSWYVCAFQCFEGGLFVYLQMILGWGTVRYPSFSVRGPFHMLASTNLWGWCWSPATFWADQQIAGSSLRSLYTGYKTASLCEEHPENNSCYPRNNSDHIAVELWSDELLGCLCSVLAQPRKKVLKM